jgi:GTPase
LHVADASISEDMVLEQIAAVETVLREIEGDALPVELVFNKIDLVDALTRRRLSNRFPHALTVSAVTGEGLDELRRRLAERFAGRYEDVRLFVPYDQGQVLAALYELGAPIEERTDAEDGVLVRARLPHREVRRFASYLVAEPPSESVEHA